jgi:cell division septation protein DedD
MDRALIERMVGAVVLVLVLVMLAPALLDGERNGEGTDSSSASEQGRMRTEVIVLNEPLNPRAVAEPEADSVEFPVAKGSTDRKKTDQGKSDPQKISPDRVARQKESAADKQSVAPAKPVVARAEPEPVKPKQTAAALADKPIQKAAPIATKVAPPVPAPQPVAKAIVTQRQAPAQSVPLRSPPPAGFAVQLGSFSSRENAENYALAVRKEGFEVFLTLAAMPSGSVYRVHAGPRPTRAAAEKLSAVLAGSGRSVMIVDLNAQGGK